MTKTAVFPGSFDPVTIGHIDIVKRALPLFDKLIIAIGSNSEKKYLFSEDIREAWLKDIFSSEKKIEVMRYDGLTVDFCKKNSAQYILRGIRTSADFEFERLIAQSNSQIAPDVETVFILSRPEYSHISSSIVRDIIRHKGDCSKFVPREVRL
ncbi:MAG TPA: pantetheine-phosphate adenylyltransferase [Bacteroidia bacterium]|nr:pantetheine-phosphate adenylyltransferase [Bacteroidia bacterium]